MVGGRCADRDGQAVATVGLVAGLTRRGGCRCTLVMGRCLQYRLELRVDEDGVAGQ